MVQIYDPIDVGGKIGASIGKGFGDQFAREVQANRLGDQLEALRDAYSKDGKTYDPLALVTGLTQIGARLGPEQGAAFYRAMPDIQRLLMNQIRPTPGQGQETIFAGAAAPSQGQGRPQQLQIGIVPLGQQQAPSAQQGLTPDAEPLQIPGVDLSRQQQKDLQELVDFGFPIPLSIETPEQAAALRQQDFRRTPEQREQAITDLIRQYGWDADKAANYIDEQENRWNQIKNDVVKQAEKAIQTENTFRNEFDNELSQLWNATPGPGGELPQLLPGEVKRNYIAQGIEQLRRNPRLSVRDLAKRTAEEANQFVKARSLLQNKTGPSGLPWILQPSANLKEFQDNLARYRNNYLKAGALNLFEEDLQTAGFTNNYAASYARPLNPELESSLKGVPVLSKAAREAFLKPSAKMQEKAQDVVKDAILKSYKPESDSLLSLQTRLFELGYGPEVLANAVADIQDEQPQFFSARDERAIPDLIAPVDGDIRNILLDVFSPGGEWLNTYIGPTRYGRPASEELTRRKTKGRFKGSGIKPVPEKKS